MPWYFLLLLSLGGLVLAVLLCLWTIRWMGHREPYGAFIRLRARRKLTFCRLLLQDSRVPLYIKLLPVAVAAYLISPIDLLPGIPLDDVAIALLALVLILKFTPRDVVEDLIQQAADQDIADSNVAHRGLDPAELPDSC
jgi:uncharacterized membrane protein YkvA (DUF1232 family)